MVAIIGLCGKAVPKREERTPFAVRDPTPHLPIKFITTAQGGFDL